jgi:hypothetical protein
MNSGDTIIFIEMLRFGRNSGELVNRLQLFIKKKTKKFYFYRKKIKFYF